MRAMATLIIEREPSNSLPNRLMPTPVCGIDRADKAQHFGECEGLEHMQQDEGLLRRLAHRHVLLRAGQDQLNLCNWGS
jgi:hypothetical protein